MKVSLLLCVIFLTSISIILAKSTTFKQPQHRQQTQRHYDDNEYSKIMAAGSVNMGNDGGSDVSTSTFNLAKTILGAGVLSLPAGIASFTDKKEGLFPATILLAFMGYVSAYSFSSIGNACRIHNVPTFSQAWAKSVSPKSAPFISAVVTIKTFFACLAYSIIIGDTFSSIAKSAALPEFLQSRSNMIMCLTALVITPLNLLKNLDALKYTSILGLAGILYCGLFITMRLLDGSYISGGQFFDDVPEAFRPSFGAAADKPWYSIFKLIAMISTAYVAHYSAPRFWTELKVKTMPTYNKVIGMSFAISAFMYGFIMFAGYLTFGGNSLGFILNNYSDNDVLASVSRLAIGLGILFGYPLTFCALRDGVMDLCSMPTAPVEGKMDMKLPVTLVLMTLLTIGGMTLTNLGTVVAFSGSLIGANLIYTVPALMNIANIKSEAKSKGKPGEKALSSKQRMQVNANYGLATMGVLISVIGVTVTLTG